MEVNDNDSGRILVHHPSLNDAIVVPLRPLNMLNADVVMQHNEKVLQSHEDLAITDVPKGAGRMKITDVHDNNSINKNKSLVQIVNEDIMYVQSYSCVTGTHSQVHEQRIAWSDPTRAKISILYKVMKYRKVPPSYYYNLINKNRDEQKEMAMALCELANVSTDRVLGLNDLEAFEDLLGVNILVVSARLGNTFIQVTDNTERKKRVLVLSGRKENTTFSRCNKHSRFFLFVLFLWNMFETIQEQRGPSMYQQMHSL